MINVSGVDEEAEAASKPKAKYRAAASDVKRAISRGESNSTTGTSEELEDLKSKPTKPAAKAKGSEIGKPESNSSTSSSLARSTEVEGIPEFARAAWTTSFLPALYNNLYLSERPFKDFLKGQEVVQRIQTLVDVVYPDSGYCVRWGDDLCQTVCYIFFLSPQY
jgi:hypothetical protein